MLMSPRPCGPEPITPRTMRLLGATLPPRPSAEAGIMAGKAAAAKVAPAAPRTNCRRLIGWQCRAGGMLGAESIGSIADEVGDKFCFILFYC